MEPAVATQLAIANDAFVFARRGRTHRCA